MSVELILHRFERSAGDHPKRPGTLADLISVAERVIADDERQASIEITREENGFIIGLPDGFANVRLGDGSFPAGGMDKTTFRLVFEVAKAGDMVIVAEGGKYPVILTDPGQSDALPYGWIKSSTKAPVCHSADELATLLKDWIDINRRYSIQMRREFEKRTVKHAVSPIPGKLRDSQRESIYIQAWPGETALTHLRAASKSYRSMLRTGGHNFVKTGMLGGTAWRLEIPTGAIFYALQVSGDKEAWLAILREYASLDGRMAGQIVDSEWFVLDDGQSFSLSDCKCIKVKE
jgi:hypothetical protein